MLKMFEKLITETSKGIIKADNHKADFREYLPCESKKHQLKGTIFEGQFFIISPVWPYDDRYLEKTFNSTPFNVDVMLNDFYESEREIVTKYSITRSDNYYSGKKDLVKLETDNRHAYISGEWFKMIKDDLSDIQIYIKDEKTPLVIKWYGNIVSVIMPIKVV